VSSFLALILAAALLVQPVSRVDLLAADGASASVRVEVADEPAEWSRGLMNRTEMVEDVGMLFVFPADVDYAFWMQDTPLPLSIAFIAADGRIVDLQDMAPLSTDLHVPAGPYRYALEVNQGYFARHSLRAGDRAVLWETRSRLVVIDR
jgi:uncharacterized membrane protein (UPF0127 family)